MGICGSKETRESNAPNQRTPTGQTAKRTAPPQNIHSQSQSTQVSPSEKHSSGLTETSSGDKQPLQQTRPSEDQFGLEELDVNQLRKQSIVASVSSQGTSLKNAITAQSGNKDSHEYTKVLLLGTGESGKSTILQQLRILHSSGFTDQELYDFKPFIFSNIVSSAKDLISAYRQFNVQLQGESFTEDDLNTIMSSQSPVDPTASFDPKLASLIQSLWKCQYTTTLLQKHRQEFYLMDSAKYFFEELDRISQVGYKPTEADVVRTRKKTSGIFDLKFELQGLKIHIFDVGGQRSERKKWIYCFDNVASIIFCVALSEYDQVLLEDKQKNRLEESLTLFDSVANSRWFSRCSIILFLNKIDVFVDKLPYSPLENHFPDYRGGSDANKAAKYILWRFTRLNRSGLPIYPYITQATDKNNMKLVFVVVRESIFSNILQDTGLLS